ncbi:hypothetical protein NIES4071_28170 [Calothrix sp. NIES-4071]|nr:hypothetical protein NIES4071_28170 [Calothrix sp. NIES-4071]BAZ57139.1 hypothetical protein NIES4105_28110 [Calothrix sp. NIES-4105]
MARKRSLFHGTVQSILKPIFLALLTLTLSLTTPLLTYGMLRTSPPTPLVLGEGGKISPPSLQGKGAEGLGNLQISQASNGLKLEQQGESYYNTGSFAEAAKVWQQAADAYGKDEEGVNRNLVNKARALQALGLYPEACNQILQTFIKNFTCDELIQNKIYYNTQDTFFINQLENQSSSLSELIRLRLLSEILQRIGKLETAQKILNINLKKSDKYSEEKSASLLNLGTIERLLGDKKRNQLDYDKIVVAIKNKCNEFDNNSGEYAIKKKCNTETTSELYKQTFNHYKQAINYYDQVVTQQVLLITKVKAELNKLSLWVEVKEWWTEQISKSKTQKLNWDELQKELNDNIQNLLHQIKPDLDNLPQNRETVREVVYSYINFSNSLIRLKSTTKEDFLPQQDTAKLLATAIQLARTYGDKQAEALALSNLARLYELQVSEKENLTNQEKLDLATAKKLTDLALHLSNDINADNRQILYRQRHQLGRILKAQKNIEGALASYAEAWNILQSLRDDLVTSVDNQFSFRQTVEPIYQEFIDLLLKSESSKLSLEKLEPILLNNINDKEKTKKTVSLTNLARIVMDSLQLAELNNFFQEPCSQPSAKPEEIINIDPQAAVIYPIILKERLEVILYLPDTQNPYHYSTDVSEEEVMNTIENFANHIYSKAPGGIQSALILNSATSETQKNPEWIEKLDNNKKEVLKISQNIYKWIIKPLEKQLESKKITSLVFILDRPFQKIPIAALHDGKNYLIEKNYNIVLNLGQQLIKSKSLQLRTKKILAAGVSEKGVARGRRFKALENVKKELEQIEKLGVSTKPLINSDFNKNNFQEKMKSSPAVVHLATHGVFSSNREQTFILTGDNDSIGIDDFQNLLNPYNRVSNKSIELLVLSACETASGDERAALGIAGVAQRSGASSTIATLWSVSDDAAAKLMVEFYNNLIKRNMTRTEALRSAQQLLLKDKTFEHPFYWAPFILIGNWL